MSGEKVPGKVIGKPDDLNLELFTAIVASDRMCLQKCDNCGNYHHPPRMYCNRCFSGDHSYPPVSGAGTVHSYTVSHHTAEPAWRAELPFVSVVVELDEGPRVVGAGVVDDPESVRIGQRVQVVPERRTDDFAYLTVHFDKQDNR
jgi:uncharacterized OB-fold protein